MTFDVLRVIPENPTQLVCDSFAALVRCIDMHSEKLGDLTVVPVLEIIFTKDESFLVREFLEDIGTCLAMDPRMVRKAELIFVDTVFHGAVIIFLCFLAVLERCNFIVEVCRILLIALNQTAYFIFEKIIHIAAKATSNILVTLDEREENNAEVIINLVLILMAIPFDHEVEFRRNHLCGFVPRILSSESFLQVIFWNEQTYERALLGVLEIDLPRSQENDVLLEERMEPFEEFVACCIRVDAFELRSSRLELCLIFEY